MNENQNSPKSIIRPLPELVANQIAAGEVVERPASVIKELIENSIDAGATKIDVIFRNGGKSYMEVTDNGRGMSRDDAMMAFEPHTTSKIHTTEELKRIKTLGFRGEALSSIASISRATLTSSMDGADYGTRVLLVGGILKEVMEAPPIKGTSIIVKDLFFNTPVRRKFLRSEQIEATHLTEAVTREALARPSISFTLVRGGRTVYNSVGEDGDGAFLGRIVALIGNEIADELLKVDFEYAGMNITGFCGRPAVTRSGRFLQYVYINGRFVRDKIITRSIYEAYRSLLPKGRHPVVFLNIEILPERVDVNVHPHKTEVRFVDQRSIISLVEQSISLALLSAKSDMPERMTPIGARISPKPLFSGTIRPFSDKEGLNESVRFWQRPEETTQSRPESQNEAVSEQADKEPGVDESAQVYHFDGIPPTGARIIGQVFTSFILMEEGDRLYMVDQHTAHERILFENFKNRYLSRDIDSQQILFPENLELTGTEADILSANLESFDRLGFSIEPFGENIFTISSAPSVLVRGESREIVMELLAKMRDGVSPASIEDKADECISIMACRGAVKAGDILLVDEMRSLIGQLETCSLPYTCPHGRPIVLAVMKDDLLKSFLRS